MVAFSLSSVAKANKQKASAKGIKTSRVKKDFSADRKKKNTEPQAFLLLRNDTTGL